MNNDLHRAAQIGAGVLVSVLFLTIGFVLMLDLCGRPEAWGGVLMITGASYGLSILWVVKGNSQELAAERPSR